MKFYIRSEERPFRDVQEEAAMLQHRLNSIAYWESKLDLDDIEYVFKSEDCATSFLLVQNLNAKSLDWLIKRDPLFPFSQSTSTPVISTRDLIEEIEDYIGEEFFSEDELARFEPKPLKIEPEATYFMVYKHQPAFSPLLSEEVQTEIYRRTAHGQKGHESSIEISDVNPVGSTIGIHIAKTEQLDDARRPVINTMIFPDTNVEFSRVLTLFQSKRKTILRMQELGRVPLELQA
jgi:hypothetical protein